MQKSKNMKSINIYSTIIALGFACIFSGCTSSDKNYGDINTADFITRRIDDEKIEIIINHIYSDPNTPNIAIDYDFAEKHPFWLDQVANNIIPVSNSKEIKVTTYIYEVKVKRGEKINLERKYIKNLPSHVTGLWFLNNRRLYEMNFPKQQ